MPTIRELGEAWTRGDLARDYPDHVRKKKSVGHDIGRLENYVYPVVGDIRIDAFTLDHARIVMRGMTTENAVATRRHVAQLMNRIFKMAVFPLQLIATNPLPPGFLPKIGPGKAKGWVYPDEDVQLVASYAVPLEYRVFYGFLHREGPRVNEAARLTWSDLDLDRGSLVLDVNKTNDPRAWALSPGVARGLGAWRTLLSQHGVSTKGSDFVFVDLHGERLNENHAAARYREHLLAAGIDRANEGANHFVSDRSPAKVVGAFLDSRRLSSVAVSKFPHRSYFPEECHSRYHRNTAGGIRTRRARASL